MRALTATIIQQDLAGVPKRARDCVKSFRLLIVLGAQLRALMDRRLASSDITTQQAALLAAAGAADIPPTQGELASSLAVSHQNIRQLTDALQRKGFVDVRIDRSDRRAKRIVPTKAARAMFARRNPQDFEAVADWFSALNEQETELLVNLLGRLAEAIASEHQVPPPIPRSQLRNQQVRTTPTEEPGNPAPKSVRAGASARRLGRFAHTQPRRDRLDIHGD